MPRFGSRALPGLAAALLVLGLAAGCSRKAPGGQSQASAGSWLGPGPDSRVAQDPAVRAQMLINAGNQAFHAGDYSLAARRYAAAAVERKDDPVAYFGLGMALTRLGRDEDARAAYAKARELTQLRRR